MALCCCQVQKIFYPENILELFFGSYSRLMGTGGENGKGKKWESGKDH